MCKNVVPLKVSPKWPILEYAAVKPVNQSFVTQTAGMIYLWQQNSKQALLNTAI